MVRAELKPTVLSSAHAVVHRWQLPNGLVLLFHEDRNAPLVAVEAVVRTGSATEGALLGTGVSHVVEHMLFKGTASRPVGAIERAIKSYGGQINGHTTHDYTGYTLTVHRDHLADAVPLLADAIQHPLFDAGELTRELDVVLRELKLRRDDPEQYTADLVWAGSYRLHPYRVPIIGYESLLISLGRDELIQYHRAHYQPNQTVLAIAGDARWPEVRAVVEQAFGAWPRGLEPAVSTPAEPVPVALRVIEETADVAVAHLVLTFPSVALASQDLAALDTLARILGEGRGSRLDRALREPGIVHEVASWNYTPRDPGLFAIVLRLDPERLPEATPRIWEVIHALQGQPVATSELEAAKRGVTAQYLFGRQTVGAQAADLAVNEVLVGDPEFSRHYVEQVHGVTVDDVQRVALQYLVPSRAVQVVVRPRGTPGPTPPAATGAPEIVPSAATPEAPIEFVTLANGTRVLVREDRRLPIVTLRVTSLGGVLDETEDTNGLSMLTARMLLRGTASRSAQELTDLIRSLGGELASASGRNSVGVSMGLLSQDVATGLAVLSDVWYHPAFPADEFLKEQRLLVAEIRQAEDDLFEWGSRRLFRALFPEHPYGWPPAGTAESVSRLSVASVAAHHRRWLDPRRTLVSVFGDVHRRDVLPLIEQAFGPPQAPTALAPRVSINPPLTGRRQVEDAWPRAETIVFVGFRGTTVTDPERVVLDVVDMVLGGSGGRLYTEVRERRGQAYTVGSSAMHGVDPGSLVLYAVTAPDQADAVVTALLDEVHRLRTVPVSSGELAVAQQGLIGAHGIRLQTNGAVSLQTSLDELYGLGWQAYRDYPAKVLAVTPDDIRRVAQRYLTPEACVVFIGRPHAAEGLSPKGTVPPQETAGQPIVEAGAGAMEGA